jgi:hypothetical protein
MAAKQCMANPTLGYPASVGRAQGSINPGLTCPTFYFKSPAPAGTEVQGERDHDTNASETLSKESTKSGRSHVETAKSIWSPASDHLKGTVSSEYICPKVV